MVAHPLPAAEVHAMSAAAAAMMSLENMMHDHDGKNCTPTTRDGLARCVCYAQKKPVTARLLRPRSLNRMSIVENEEDVKTERHVVCAPCWS